MFSLFSSKKAFLDKEQQQQVVAAIREAEAITSGEIRVFMEPHCSLVNTMERAQQVFVSLQMEKTVERNAVLVYIAFRDREFALFGDSAIYEKAGGQEFWKKSAAALSASMREGKYAEGLSNCVRELGKALAAHFPPDPNINKNELPDEIVFGK